MLEFDAEVESMEADELSDVVDVVCWYCAGEERRCAPQKKSFMTIDRHGFVSCFSSFFLALGLGREEGVAPSDDVSISELDL